MFVGVLLTIVLVSFVWAKSSGDAWLGVYTQSVDKELSEAFDLNVEYGAVINQIVDDSPADDADLRDGDVIIEINGDKVRDNDDLIDIIEDHKAGDEVVIKYYRNGRERETSTTLGDADDYNRYERKHRYFSVPSVPSVPSAPSVPQIYSYGNHGKNNVFFKKEDYHHGYLGVNLQNLNDQLGDYFGVRDGEGVLIESVEEDSPAKEAGLMAGDVIIKIDDEEMEDYGDVTDFMSETKKGDEVAVTVLREKREKTINVTVDENKSHSYSYSFSAPDIDIRIPDIQWFKQSDFDDDDANQFFDAKEYKEMMRAYEKEMQQLKKELKGIDRETSRDLAKELKQLKKELQELREKVDD